MYDSEMNSMIKYLVGASRIKFSVLDEIFKEIHINQDMIVMYVDAHSILYRLYRLKSLDSIYSLPAEVAVKDLVVSFINVLGHYRRYFATHLGKTNDIIVTFNRKLPNYQGSIDPDYQHKLYEIYEPDHKDYSALTEIVDTAIQFIKSIVPYFEGIYFLENEGIDDYAAMYYMMTSEKYNGVYNLIFSRNILPTQLIGNTCSQLYNKRDSSYLITNNTVYQNGILKDRKTVASENLTSDLLPFIWTLSGCSDIGLKKSKYVGSTTGIVKLFNKLVDQHIIKPGMSIQSFLKEISDYVNNGAEFRMSMNKMMDRYRLVNISLATSAISKSQAINLWKNVFDLYDQEGLELINDKLAEINGDAELLEITNLNMATVENDFFI